MDNHSRRVVVGSLALSLLLLGIGAAIRVSSARNPEEPQFRRDRSLPEVVREQAPESRRSVARVSSTPSVRIQRSHPLGISEDGKKPTVLATNDVLRQNEQGFTYNSSAYGATIEDGAIDIGLMGLFEDKTRPRWGYRFEEMRVGSKVIARGGQAVPSQLPQEFGLAYRRGEVEEHYILGTSTLEQSFLVKSLPALDEDLIVSGQITTNLVPPPEGKQGGRLDFGIE